jgi:hypothetical protein
MGLANPAGLWLSFLNRSVFPIDGIIIINDPDARNDFDGVHYRTAKTPINGHFEPENAGAATPAHIKFTEMEDGVTYTYEANIVEATPNFFVTDKGKRSASGPAGATTDDWVGTHTT